jgi:hypothetical protein
MSSRQLVSELFFFLRIPLMVMAAWLSQAFPPTITISAMIAVQWNKQNHTENPVVPLSADSD